MSEDLYKIEDAQPEDVKTLRTIVKNSWLKLYPNETYGITGEDIAGIGWYKETGLERRRKEILEDRDTIRTWVLKNNENEVVGFCKVFKFEDYGEINGMYIIEELQGKGLGRKLIEKAFGWLDPKKDIKLKVVAYNTRAIGFYEKMGFEKADERTISFSGTELPSGKEIPRIEMVKKGTN